MTTTKTFTRDIPASEDEIFRFIGNAEGGILLIIENLSDNNTMVYKIQESYDGTTWVDKTFSTSEGGTTTQFTIIGGSHHELKATYTRQMVRMMASGNLTANILISHRSPSTLSDQLSILAS